MIFGILLLAIAVFGISILFGRGKTENYYKFLIWLIFAPLLLAIGFNHMLWLWYGLPPLVQILSVLLLPFFISVLLRMLFPKAAWLEKLQAALFEASLYAVTFPFRFLFRASKLFIQKERGKARLNPNRAFVGSKPPILEASEKSKNRRFDT